MRNPLGFIVTNINFALIEKVLTQFSRTEHHYFNKNFYK